MASSHSAAGNRTGFPPTVRFDIGVSPSCGETQKEQGPGWTYTQELALRKKQSC